jgi:hypothetical protein
VDIIGSGSTFTIVDGGGLGSVFTIEPDELLTISGMTIRNRAATNGAGIYNDGALTVNNCKLINNHATSYGGAVYNNGILTVKGSTFTGNTAYDGGAIYDSDAGLTLDHDVISNNHADDYGWRTLSLLSRYNNIMHDHR